MIPADLLSRLREADHGLYFTWEDVLGPYKNDLISNAVLQACIQDAIRTRGWGYVLLVRFGKCYAWIRYYGGVFAKLGADPIELGQGVGDTEAEALLRAYLEAITEAKRE